MDLEKLISLLRQAEEITDIDKERDNIAAFLPGIKRMFDFDQKNSAHQYMLWEHSLHVVLNLEKDIGDDMLFVAALLHDIGKPDCQTISGKDGDTNMHYYGHPRRSMEIVREEILPQIEKKSGEVPEDDKRRLLYYIEYHDDRMSLRIKHLRQHLRIPVSFTEFQNLMCLQVADAKAHKMIPVVTERIKICKALSGDYGEQLYQRILSGE